MGRIIGFGGENIKNIKHDTQTDIKKSTAYESGFHVTGKLSDCEKARQAITDCLENKEERNYQKIVEVQKKYITIVVGKDHKNIDDIATKSETKIIVPSRRTSEDAGGDTIPIKIIGPQANCDRAETLIQQCVVIIKDRQKRNEYGGDTKFVCFDFKEKTEEFRLISDVSPPKLDGFIKGMRYRIKTNDENDFNHDRTVLEIRERLLTPLQNIRQCKDEKGLLIDLWCHFGKVFVSNVDEEETMETLTAEAINGRLLKIMTDKDELKGKNRDAFWRVSFEEGVDPSRINEDAFEEDEYLDFKLDHTQWRYDFGFTTPTGRNVRFKVWEGLPSDTEDEPPMEVKNILTQVVLRGNESIKAWLCYPSTSVLRGEIMIPASPYDCRIKLRGGPRYVTDKDEVCLEEDAILSDYLSHCTIDTAEHKMSIPDDKDHEMPEGFAWTFYRRAEEKMYRTSLDDEGFLVIVLDESGGDSDASSWREKKQLGFRVVMDAWTDALLSTERNWKPEEIVDKLGIYMRFLGLLQSVLFLDAIVDPS
ncbi:uncharacterized protein LOC114521994 [Dendronephthya gigantea]|uniref:uncharacterized protein LOC114521994 n=1 Tax=Dendronephthya gigantea TaxID=151771 RepID=UPI001068E338|nr:uncharacterized protein LOC114521994 [Dendronephthya gigantea]